MTEKSQVLEKEQKTKTIVTYAICVAMVLLLLFHLAFSNNVEVI
jgi:hypothetical protein